MLKPLPIGIQTFRDIIEGGFLYVDKTRWIYELVRYPKGVYFLSRPRRFGKSLLISTLSEIFAGHRELFRGLWLYNADYPWTPHPVIRVDFSLERVRTAEELSAMLTDYLHEIAEMHGITLRGSRYAQLLRELLRKLAARGKVVVLIDEYDKPIIDNLENTAEVRQIRDVLKGFYIVLKGMDAYLRFVLLTGVSKFSKVGVFSGLNNLQDITMSNRYAAMLGITHQELTRDFAEHIAAFAEELGTERDALIAKIRRWYDGFCFSRACHRVYNPFSLLMLFSHHEFRSYWFETGTPSFLVELIRRDERFDVTRMDDLLVEELAFSTYEVDRLRPLPLLFQTGYLTIKGYEGGDAQLYRLGYPNREVANAFSQLLLEAFGSVEREMAGAYLWQLIRALRRTDLPRFFEVLDVFFANIPYDIHIRQERYYQTIFFLIFKLLGLKVEAEVRTSRGRIDAVVEVAEAVYVFEFKLRDDPEAALAQIEDRRYLDKYRDRGKPLFAIGVQFSLKQGRVLRWTHIQS